MTHMTRVRQQTEEKKTSNSTFLRVCMKIGQKAPRMTHMRKNRKLVDAKARVHDDIRSFKQSEVKNDNTNSDEDHNNTN